MAARSLAGLGSLHDADAIAASLPGAFHFTVSMAGRVRVQGTVCGSRQIFYAQVSGLGIAASSVAPLRRLTGAQIDETMLAARLLAPAGPPWPLSQRPIWRGIEALEAGHWLLLDGYLQPAQKRWWKPPEASAPLPVAAQAVRAALFEAVALRAVGTISADLSGGLDSTCLCFLAAAAVADLVTYHTVPLDQANQDTVWAREAAALLPSARHRTLPAEREENWFNVGYTADAADTDPEGPGNWAEGLPHIRDLTSRALAEGASTHLMGLGGDELFGPMPRTLVVCPRTSDRRPANAQPPPAGQPLVAGCHSARGGRPVGLRARPRGGRGPDRRGAERRSRHRLRLDSGAPHAALGHPGGRCHGAGPDPRHGQLGTRATGR